MLAKPPIWNPAIAGFPWTSKPKLLVMRAVVWALNVQSRPTLPLKLFAPVVAVSGLEDVSGVLDAAVEGRGSLEDPESRVGLALHIEHVVQDDRVVGDPPCQTIPRAAWPNVRCDWKPPVRVVVSPLSEMSRCRIPPVVRPSIRTMSLPPRSPPSLIVLLSEIVTK